MLNKLLPDQVATYWDLIKEAIERSVPPIEDEHPDKMNRILASLLSGRKQCWVSYRKDNGTKVLEGIVVTEILVSDDIAMRSLLIYSVFAYGKVPNETWTDGLKTIAKWATKMKCHRIIAYTDVPKLINFVKMVGGEARYTFVSIPL